MLTLPDPPRWLRPALAGCVVGQLGLALLIDARLSPAEHAPWAARLGAVVLLGLLWLAELAGARLPRPVLVLATAVPVAWLNIVRDGAVSLLFLLLAVAWTTYTTDHRRSVAGLCIALAAALSYLVNRDPEGWLSTSLGMVVTWFAVRGLLRQQRLLAEQARLVLQLRAAQEDLAREARAAERRRIAREIHDVAAHTLAVTMLQLTGVRLLLQRTSGDHRAVEALAQAEVLGRQGLDDVRRTVGLLADAATPGGAPLPGAADLAALVGEYRAAGVDVGLDVRGDPAELPTSVGLALYRIAQEGLANATRHAPGAVVSVDVQIDQKVLLRVRNGPARHHVSGVRPERSSGLGLPGMRERAELLGGTLSAGRDRDGWLVECTLPGAPEALPATTRESQAVDC